MKAAPSILTAAQLLEAGDIGRCELVRGELVMMSPAGARHGCIAARVAHQLLSHTEKHRLGAIFAAETGFHIARNPDSVRAPDVAFVKTERVDRIPERGFFPGAPDLAVEVLSPDDTASEVLEKMHDWLRAGTQAVWIVDPQRKTVSVYRSHQPVHVLAESDHITAEDLLPGLRVKVADIFR